MSVRVGIDVGGTFTDAVAVDDSTFELIGSVKIPTTHTAKDGVAAGIVIALNDLMQKYSIAASDIVFIAHGTTQATNALLEGDVAPVGIITIGKGVEGWRSKADTNIGDVILAKGKKLRTYNAFISSGVGLDAFREGVDKAIEDLSQKGAVTFAASEAFSVDNPENENAVVERCAEKDFPATAGNDVSKLYGLKVRTRTAVINASILPKMLEAASLTERSIKNAKIEAPLMVMRCDGGVMTIDEVRGRPILTILSGPAAGVAGALMYEKLTDGIFLEVGGTSTDISCVRDGNILIRYAEVGGHKTYLNSLDVRTVGIGGGSMIELSSGKAVDVGPRSAHIAKLEYEVYQDEKEVTNPVLMSIRPLEGDAEYAYIECDNGKRFALTLSGAANIAGFVPDGDYARGNVLAARKAWKPLAENMGISVEETALKILEFSANKNGVAIENFINDYKLNKETLVLVGGGGGASTVVGHLAKRIGCKFKIARNAPVISPIGVSLAMVREMVERTIPSATDKDVLAVRNEAFEMAVKAGANADTVEVTVSVDPRTNKVRAVAIGTTELRAKDLNAIDKTIEELRLVVAENLKCDLDEVSTLAENEGYVVFQQISEIRKFGFFRVKTKRIRLIDREGVIRLQRKNASVYKCSAKEFERMTEKILDDNIVSGEGGEEIPNIYIACSHRIISLSGIQKKAQMLSLIKVELAAVPDTEILLFIVTLTTENERG
jgi:N-methylhydantoinase A/oxoprolinase/acetone carboxylase beta subunit